MNFHRIILILLACCVWANSWAMNRKTCVYNSYEPFHKPACQTKTDLRFLPYASDWFNYEKAALAQNKENYPAIIQSDDERIIRHQTPLIIEQLYWSWLIKQSAKNDKSLTEKRLYVPGAIYDINRELPLIGFFESTIVPSPRGGGESIEHRCFNSNLKADRPEAAKKAAIANKIAYTLFQNLKKDYTTNGFRWQTSNPPKQMTIPVPNSGSQEKITYEITETITNNPDCIIPKIDIIDTSKPNITYQLQLGYIGSDGNIKN